jgi:FKBP-type peptidyl-prolyl cis-trans isomerase
MKMIKSTLSLLAAVIIFASCNQFQKSPSGMPYKITKGNSKELLKHGQFVKLNIEYKLKSKDTVLNTSYGHIPMYFYLDTARLGKYTFTEVITKCAPGDKMEFSLSIDSLKKMGMIEFNEVFKTGDFINGKLEVIASFAKEDLVKADYEKEVEKEKGTEIAAIKKYAESKNMKTVSTKSGALVEITNPGTGQKADSGYQVSVMYRGYFADKDGKEFDANIGKPAPDNKPIDVFIGQNGVIPGWEEGLTFFAKGGKGRIVEPSSQPGITPF